MAVAALVVATTVNVGNISIVAGGSQANYNAHNPVYLLTQHRYTGQAGWFEAGAQDSESLQAGLTLQKLASNAGLDTCITTPPGGHSFDLWAQAFKGSLPCLSWKLKLTPEPPSVPARCGPGKS